MSEWRLVRLNFGRSPTHFGQVGIGLEETTERLQSDTLFSALISTYARLFNQPGDAVGDKPKVEVLLDKFLGPSTAPPFRLSSTFVYRRQGDGFIDYLPKLAGEPLGYPDDDLSFAKAYKKLTYLPKSVWQRWYQGSGFAVEDGEELKKRETKESKADGAALPTALAQAETFSYGDAFTRYTLPKVAIDRTTRATNFYHTGLIQFAWQPGRGSTEDWGDPNVEPLAGLYFLLELPEAAPELEQELRQTLTVLGETGVGGERSSGAGRFTVCAWEELPADWAAIVNFEGGDHHGLISLFWNKSLDRTWLGESARYGVQDRGGWIASPSGRQLRRQMIRMFTEGSVFPKQPVGRLADVTPRIFDDGSGEFVPHPGLRHSVYRSGVALSLSVKLKEEVA